MSVVVVNELHGGDQQVYDEVNPRVMPEGALPDGCQAHIAGPMEGGWRVITVWESAERFNEFRDGTLLPAMEESGHADRISPSVGVQDVYRFITA
jgi:hypothetical protein